MRGVFGREQLRSTAGYVLLRRMADGEFAHAPIYRTFGIRLVEVEAGKVVFEAEPSERYYNPIGTIHGGYISMLLDSCMGCAIHSLLPAGTSYTTIDIKVNYVRALRGDVSAARASGCVVHLGRRIATAEGRLHDRSGKLYAHGLSTCAILPVDDGVPPTGGRPELDAPAGQTAG